LLELLESLHAASNNRQKMQVALMTACG